MSRALYLLGVVVVLAGCDALTFSPGGEPFTEVDPTAAPLVVDFATADTVKVWGTVQLALRYEGRRADRLEMYVGSDLVAEATGAEAIAFDSRRAADGVRPLRLRVIAASQTGSLATRR